MVRKTVQPRMGVLTHLISVPAAACQKAEHEDEVVFVK